jgi:hypothetical protein
MEERELREIRRLAREEHVPVAEWVRRTLRSAARNMPASTVDKKLAAVRAATSNSYPTAEVEQLLVEIEQGYGQGDAR